MVKQSPHRCSGFLQDCGSNKQIAAVSHCVRSFVMTGASSFHPVGINEELKSLTMPLLTRHYRQHEFKPAMQLINDEQSLDQQIARAILIGFDKHYRIFTEITLAAKTRFEQCQWQDVQEASRERIKMYDQRVNETVAYLKKTFDFSFRKKNIWQDVKKRYCELLAQHHQPELAETFYNSVFCQMFERRYYNNDNIFVKSTVEPSNIPHDKSLIKSFVLKKSNLLKKLTRCAEQFEFDVDYINLNRDLLKLLVAFKKRVSFPLEKDTVYRLDICSSLFYRNKVAYIVGRVVCTYGEQPFMLAIKNESGHGLYFDGLITEASHLLMLFGFARAYFMAYTEVPAAMVSFLQSIMPSSRRLELYTMIGLQKQGKTEFYRDFLNHLETSDDQFVIAPGIKGMVMTVFTLHSYPYVFKVIKDKFAPSKKITRQTVKEKYLLVKMHDRVGRMADTLEYSYVAFPKNRFSDELLAELRQVIPSQLTVEDDYIVIRHLYIERRVKPLNIYLTTADEENTRHAIDEYGNTIRQLIKANIFPGDMLLKNFGMTKQGRVVFYDYDEITYMTDCNFRRIPPARHPDEEMFDMPHYSVNEGDIFPEEIATVALTTDQHRKLFRELHSELLDAKYWNDRKASIEMGLIEDVNTYPKNLRISRR